MSQNPLSKFYRQPAVYIKLPSNGRYWPEGSINIPPNGEIPVLPMSAKDDISMRNADALMNGATTVDIIQSCIPNILDAWKTPSIDIDALLIAIRLASYGNKMEFDTACAKCNEELSYETDLGQVLENINIPDFEKPLEVNDLLIWFKPNKYSEMNDTNQQKYQQQRLVKSITESNINEEQMIVQFKQAVNELTVSTISKLACFIDYIITPDGTRVDDHEQIKEFVQNADQKMYNAIKDHLSQINQEYSIRQIDIKCSACGHEDHRTFQFEPSNFFG